MKKFLLNALSSFWVMLLLSACLYEETIAPDGARPDSDVVATNLNTQIQFPVAKAYDSAFIIFRNDEEEIKQKLILDHDWFVASGAVADISRGTWEISISFFTTVDKNYKSLESNAVAHLEITSTARDLVSKQNVIFINNESNIQKPLNWVEYYYYQLHMYSDNLDTPEGSLRLPLDPTNPFVEIVTFKPKWIYAYADRSFYNRSLDGNRNYYQGGSAFEVYGQSGITYDRLAKTIVDTTSLASGISKVLNKEWNYVDCLVIVSGADSRDELLIYHVWDLRNSTAVGRMEFDQ